MKTIMMMTITIGGLVTVRSISISNKSDSIINGKSTVGGWECGFFLVLVVELVAILVVVLVVPIIILLVVASSKAKKFIFFVLESFG